MILEILSQQELNWAIYGRFRKIQIIFLSCNQTFMFWRKPADARYMVNLLTNTDIICKTCGCDLDQWAVVGLREVWIYITHLKGLTSSNSSQQKDDCHPEQTATVNQVSIKKIDLYCDSNQELCFNLM